MKFTKSTRSNRERPECLNVFSVYLFNIQNHDKTSSIGGGKLSTSTSYTSTLVSYISILVSYTSTLVSFTSTSVHLQVDFCSCLNLVVTQKGRQLASLAQFGSSKGLLWCC